MFIRSSTDPHANRGAMKARMTRPVNEEIGYLAGAPAFRWHNDAAGAPSFACFSRRVGGSLVAHETCAFTARALALERIGSIAAHPFDSAQGRLLQKTQGWGTHSCVIGEETKTEGWATRQGWGTHSCVIGEETKTEGWATRQTDGVVAYIENQAAHHAMRNYEEEFVELLRRYGISYDPAHVLG